MGQSMRAFLKANRRYIAFCLGAILLNVLADCIIFAWLDIQVPDLRHQAPQQLRQLTTLCVVCNAALVALLIAGMIRLKARIAELERSRK